MELLSGVIGFIIGAIFGLGGALYYLKWKMNKQIGMMEQEMDQLMSATESLSKGFEGVQEAGETKKDIQEMKDIDIPEEPDTEDKKQKDEGKE
jgi:hypothetical protein